MQLLTQTLSGISALADHQRRFPPPWSVEETDACFIVRDANGQALAYVYSRMSRDVSTLVRGPRNHVRS